jgi:choline dehydrogenase
LTNNAAEVGAFVNLDSTDDYPDMQMHLVPAPLVDHGRNFLYGNGIGIHTNVCRPESRGYVGLVDKNPLTPPKIVFNFL